MESRRACGLWLFCALALCLWSQGELRTVGRDPLPVVPLLLLAGGLAAFAMALRSHGGFLPGAAADSWELSPENEVGLLVLMALATIAFRVYRLDSLPPGLNHDAALEAIYGRDIFRHPYTPYIGQDMGHETLFKYVLWATLQIWGTTRLAVVAASTICAIPTIALFYVFLRSLAGARVAVTGGFLLAFSGWHWIFGRSGWRCILVPLFECLVFAGFWYGWRTRKTWPFVAAGLGVAGGLNSYAAGRVVPLMLLAPLVPGFREDGRRALAPYRVALRWFIVVALAFSAPMLWYALWNWSSITARFRVVKAAPRLGAIWDNVQRASSMFLVRGGGDDFIVDVPLLEWLPAVFFLLGVVVCVRSLRRMESVFLLAALFLGLLPGLVSQPNPNRCIAALPVVYALAGIGLVACWAMLRHVFTARRASHATAFVTAVLLLSGYETFHQYLGDAPREVPGTYPDTLVLADHLKKHVADCDVHLVVGKHPADVLRFITTPASGPPPPPFVWHTAAEKMLRPLASIERPAAFVLDAEADPQMLDLLLQIYPEHVIESVREAGRPEGREIARVVLVSREALAHRQEIGGYLELLGPPVDMTQGGLGERRGSFDGAKDLDVCPDGTVVVADTRNDRLQAFDAQGRFLRTWGQPGDVPGAFHEPHSVACAEDGEIYALDTWNGRIQVFSPAAEFRREIHPEAYFYGPRGIAVRKGRVYVTDSGHSKVSVFDALGRPLASWGSAGGAPGQFRDPVGIAVDSSGNVYVVDSGSNRIQKFSGVGRFLAAWPLDGWTGPSLKEAYLAIDEADQLYLQDPILNAVRIFRPDGTLVGSTPTPGGTRGIAVRPRDVLLTVPEKVVSVPR